MWLRRKGNRLTDEARVHELERKGEIDFTRQRDFFDPQGVMQNVTVVGAGGIGSPTALLLSKIGIPYLTLIDDDKIEPHNLPNQFYPLSMSGQYKVSVLAKLCELFGTAEVTPVKNKVQDAKEFVQGIVVTGLDSMAAREEVWRIVKENPQVSYLVDARIGGLDIVVHSIDPHLKDDIEYYENAENATLFKDEDGVEAPCTARAMMDVGFTTASIITRNVRHRITGKKVGRTITINQETLEVMKSRS